MAHNEADFYAFIRIPLEEAMAKKTDEIKVDTYNGIKRLKPSSK